MIKFALRRNLIYIAQLIIWNAVRKLERTLMSEFLGFDRSAIFTSLMFIGDIIAGSIIYKYQDRFLSKDDKPQNFMSMMLLHSKSKMIAPDNIYKIYILIFFSAFFDFIEFTLSVSYLKKFANLSPSLQSRLSGILTISSALFFYYVLKLPIFKHQFFSLLIIVICLIMIIVSEFFFQKINIFLSYGLFIQALIIIFAIHFFNSLLDSIEKYLFEYDFLNPFKILLWEGIFGLGITLIYYCIDSPLNDIIKFYNPDEPGNFILLICLLFIYIFLCGGRNVFRIATNKIYSPMAKTLTDYILNPVYNIIDFARGKDFLSEDNLRIPYFIINLIASFIISICGCVYNEFIVLFCCKLEFDTHDQITRRATLFTKNESESSSENNSDESEDSNNSGENNNENNDEEKNNSEN